MFLLNMYFSVFRFTSQVADVNIRLFSVVKLVVKYVFLTLLSVYVGVDMSTACTKEIGSSFGRGDIFVILP